MKLDPEKVKLAAARSGADLTKADTMLLVRARRGQTVLPKTLYELSNRLNCDPEYLIVREVQP